MNTHLKEDTETSGHFEEKSVKQEVFLRDVEDTFKQHDERPHLKLEEVQLKNEDIGTTLEQKFSIADDLVESNYTIKHEEIHLKFDNDQSSTPEEARIFQHLFFDISPKRGSIKACNPKFGSSAGGVEHADTDGSSSNEVEMVYNYMTGAYEPVGRPVKHRTLYILLETLPDQRSSPKRGGMIKRSNQTFHKRSLGNLAPQKSRNARGKFKCDQCTYQTSREGALKDHLFQHRLTEMETFKCDQCDYKTLLEYDFQKHARLHKNPDKVTFETSHKSGLKKHIVVHRVEKFRCAHCSFRTVRKKYLKNHLQRHKRFKCDQCKYQTLQKCNLKNHQRLHKSPKEAAMFKCKYCKFQTLYRHNFKSHLFVVHKKSNEVDILKCEHCNFKTLSKKGLENHINGHKNAKELDMFKCDRCNFQTSSKKGFQGHVRRQKNSKMADLFKCDRCDFQTLYKNCLKLHRFRHNWPMEEKVKCRHCTYQSYSQINLASHLLLNHKTS